MVKNIMKLHPFNSVLILACILLIPVRIVAADDHFQSRYEQILKSNDVRVVYSSVTKIAVEGVSWVRHIYGAAEYILLGAPSLTVTLLTGGPFGLIEKVGWDAIVEMVKEVFQYPESAGRKIAKTAFDLGLRSYRENYRLYTKYRNGGQLSDVEAAIFVVNWFIQDYMGAAKQLYNAITSYERQGSLHEAAVDQTQSAVLEALKEQFGGSEYVIAAEMLTLAESLFTLFDSAESSAVGLGAYPPYQEFKVRVLEIEERLISFTQTTKVGMAEPDEKIVYSGDYTITSQEEINNLVNYAEIDGDLFVRESFDLKNVSGLDNISRIGGSLFITYNRGIETLKGLHNLISIGMDLTVEANLRLETLDALSGLSTVGGSLIIKGHRSLRSLVGLRNLKSVGGDLIILDCTVLESLGGLGGIMTVGGSLVIGRNEALTEDTAHMDKLILVTKDVRIFEGLLPRLLSLSRIGGDLHIMRSSATDLVTLSSLTHIGGNLRIVSNSSLSSIEGLGNVRYIGGDVDIRYNRALSLDNSKAWAKQVTIEGRFQNE